ncbi:MAG: cupin domain-containing protein [Candidatus Diapherotrites archaeon]|nr:cupin domain-containing protein [Candidatus Diapherotrites archaeon]
MKAVRPEEGTWEENPQYAKKVLLDSKELGTEGCVLQVVRFAPGSVSKAHFHKHTKEIFYSLKGTGVVKINGEEIELAEGTTVLCSPNEVHSIENNSDSEFLFLVFKLNAMQNDFFEP